MTHPYAPHPREAHAGKPHTEDSAMSRNDYSSEDFVLAMIALGGAIGLMFYGGWAFSLVWAWHAVPLGAPALPWTSATALLCIWRATTGSGSAETGKKDADNDALTAFVRVVAAYVTLSAGLFIGWVTA